MPVSDFPASSHPFPYFRTSLCQNVNLSNEGLQKSLPRIQRRVGAEKLHSQAIRKTHIVAFIRETRPGEKHSSHFPSKKKRDMKQTEHYHTFQSEGTTNKPEVNKHKIKFNFPKTRLSLSEHLTSRAQTILFHSSNNIVSRIKHLCLATQTILFRGINMHFSP